MNAVGDMVSQNLFFDPLQGRAHGLDLGDDINAIPIFVDHPRHAAHLPLDSAEAGKTCLLDFGLHAFLYPGRVSGSTGNETQQATGVR